MPRRPTRAGRRLAVLTALCAALCVDAGASEPLRADRGAAGTWQKLQKLRTTASVLHTTAHPDDEHGGLLTLLSRDLGARVAMLTLNRGESGDNAIGPELFDGLGLIRTEELRIAGEYYGLDEQHYSVLVDYGYSKLLEETLAKWGRPAVQREIVRAIRASRPFVVVSRFQGTTRDGHGNHHAAGLITQEAFELAGDPRAFPEQIEEGLRPWRPLKLYVGGARESEDWTIRVNTGVYSPWLGESYQNFANLGLSFQRSQVSGRRRVTAGDVFGYYTRKASLVEAPAHERSFFQGINTSIPGLFAALGQPEPAGAAAALAAVQAQVDAAFEAFSLQAPEACAPALARGLAATREAIATLADHPDAVFVLEVKERQFQDALLTALGLELTAVARPGDYEDPTGRFAMFAAPPTLAAVTPGQSFGVRASLVNPSPVEIAVEAIALEAADGWHVSATGEVGGGLGENQTASADFSVELAEDVAPSRPYFSRASIQQTHYDLADPSLHGRPAAPPAAEAVVRYSVDGVAAELRAPVTRQEARLPYGHVTRELMVVPEIGVLLSPQTAIVPLGAQDEPVSLEVELLNGWHGAIEGELVLELPDGWTSSPASHAFSFGAAGERASYRFDVTVAALEDRDYEIRAVARARGKEFSEGYEVVEHRDLETRYLYRDARAAVRGIDVKIAPGLRVGYVMGVGDQVPTGIAQLGAEVELLDSRALADGDLSRYDAIVTGTRAYAVREDLRTYNRRLLDYAEAGGNLIVLYNTQELVPNQHAPFPGELPRSAEEVSEEDSPVTILAPDHPVMKWPNEITTADFDGWVEQRGSKWWSEWDEAYTPLLSTHDTGQEPQSGGWLHARYGEGHYSYFAYAMHRNLPYGVAGAFRLMANVLSLGKQAE